MELRTAVCFTWLQVKEELHRLAVEPHEEWIPPSELQDLDKEGCLSR